MPGARDLLMARECLGPPVVPFYPFLGEGSRTKIDYREKRVRTFIRTSLQKDLGVVE